MANAHDFIMNLENGYDTVLKDRGVVLSHCQKLRIAIARAILKDTPILIVGESTSQLESLTDQSIQDSLWNLMNNRTTIVIAHRVSTLMRMDRILLFDSGTIVGDGTHTTLARDNVLYKKLLDTQIGGFIC
jgi:ATP-binding cassette subfamily B protein